MKKQLVLLWIGVLFLTQTRSQLTRYIVEFKDKAATQYSPADPVPYLSARAISRRTQYNIIVDSTDLPVPSAYVQQVQSIPNVTILNLSRWLNAVSIRTTDPNAITAINGLPFVKNTSAIASRPLPLQPDKWTEAVEAMHETSARPGEITGNYFDYGANSLAEIRLHHGEFLHNTGLRGNGMQIAMLDAGYFNYSNLDAFDSVVASGRVISTWDFVSGHASVEEDNTHGMLCFSTMAANIPGLFIGKSPEASFHLFRTEDASSEYPIEEFNWACGAERADSAGADIISSSLGYGYGFNPPVADYPYSSLNGDITMAARAADLAAKKGLMVFNSAGNSGNDYWRMITTPADGDSVVAVASVNVSGVVAASSSYGPSADGRVKPDLASVGVSATVQLSNNTIGTANGTSFACPNLAGLAACLWQGFPEFNNMQIIAAMKKSGSTYSNPNDRIGYGIPDMRKAFEILLKEFSTASVSAEPCNAAIRWTSKDVSAMKYELERKTAGQSSYVKVGEINAVEGKVLSVHSYELKNSLANVSAGSVSFRIRQILDTSINSFSATYLDTVEVMLSTPCSVGPGTGIYTNRVSIAPNPATEPVFLIIETVNPVEDLRIAIFDLNGRLMLFRKKSKPSGRFVIELPSQQLVRGKYFVKVSDGNKSIGKTGFLKL